MRPADEQSGGIIYIFGGHGTGLREERVQIEVFSDSSDNTDRKKLIFIFIWL